jgi:hypothetical protein
MQQDFIQFVRSIYTINTDITIYRDVNSDTCSIIDSDINIVEDDIAGSDSRK